MPGYRSEVMVGRERELDVLRSVAAQARDRHPAMALLIGEAGVGKSRLASELAAELDRDGWACAVSHGVELAGGELPFGATAELLRSLVRTLGLDEVRRTLGAQTRVLATIVPTLGRTDDSSAVDRPAVTGAVLTLLESLARPVCWVLDDLQWMDAPSRDLAAYLSRVLEDASVLLVATVRTRSDAPDQVPADLVEVGRLATVVALGPLGPQDVAAQVAAIPGHRLEPVEVARICDVSDGLPFFVEQLVTSGGRVTGSLRSVVLAGFQTLTPAARTLLQAAAVGEGMLVPRHLREVSGLRDRFGAALEEVREHGVLRPDREGELLAFRHALLRETVDASMLADERRALHRAWAEALDTALESAAGDRRMVMERARHQYAVGGAQAFPAVLAAARAAELSDDDPLRARWWRRALELWPQQPTPGPAAERDKILAKYLEALWAVADLDTVLPLLDRELDRTNDWLRSLWLRLHLRETRRAVQLSAESPVPVEAAESTVASLLSVRDDFRVPWILVHLALDWFVDSEWTDRPELQVHMLEEAIRKADPGVDAPVVVEASAMLGWCDAVSGDHEGETARMRQALAWAEEHQPSSVLSARVGLSHSLANAGHYQEAIALAEANLDEIRDPLLRPHLWVSQHLLLAAARLSTDGWDLAARSLELADTAACGGDIGAWRDFLLATLCARRGNLAVARTHLEHIPHAPTDAPDGELGMERLLRQFATIEIAVAAGDTETARTAVLRVIGLVKPESPPIDVWEACDIALRVALRRAPEDPATREFVDSIGRGIAGREHRGRVVESLHGEVEAHLHRVHDTDSADHWARVAGAFAELGRVYDAAWCGLFEAECALRDGDPGRAGAVLRSAWSTCTRLGAVPLRERVETTARRGRIDGVAARGARGPTTGLTVRETEVLRLLAEGLTNAQIAESLFMSPKTASVHVSHIIAKLGVANRTEAAARAHRSGILLPDA